MQLSRVKDFNCEHAKTVLSAKDFNQYIPPPPDPGSFKDDVILVCLRCKQWTWVEFK